MKTKIRRKIKYILYKLGLYPVSPDQLFYKSKHQSQEESQHELQKTAHFISHINDHDYYTQLLKKFVPEWDISIDSAQFIGEGRGHNNINAHRKVCFKDKTYFEKVYFTNSKDFKSILWFHHQIQNQLSSLIRVPKLESVFKGELISIVYQEFIHFKELPQKEEGQAFINLSKDLYHISNDKLTTLLNNKESADFKDVFRIILGYKTFKNSTQIKSFQQKGIDIIQFEQALLNSKHILTHGDIRQSNAFKNQVLIDWDNVGFYPIGYDPAHIYYNLLLQKQTDQNLEKWLKTHYKTTIIDTDWHDFERNVHFYIFLFMEINFFNQPQNLEIKTRIEARLKALSTTNL